ncbi:hypothetical protein DMA11_07530 [Marinilabiliaceae bacterium JC017]|nr:hypothetical protein DMA11_07530 [Marinilabiliaceae bacterium JC017]
MKETNKYYLNYLINPSTFRNWIFILVIILGTGFFSGCEKDDDPVIEKKEEKTEVDKDKQPSEEGTNITLYKVAGGKIEKIKDFEVKGDDLKIQKEKAKHTKLWELTKKIVPQDYRKYIGEFMIMNSEEVAGYVSDVKEDLSLWQFGLAINLAYANGEPENNKDFVYTIIHEFGHILSLNISQVDASVKESDCTHYFTGEGCARSDSYFYQFYKEFWEPIWHEFIKVESDDDRSAFYEKFSDQFVTDYAATNPGEDFAETFANFVLSDKPKNSSIANKKILFMHQQENLVQLRKHIRTEFKSLVSLKGATIYRIPWKR